MAMLVILGALACFAKKYDEGLYAKVGTAKGEFIIALYFEKVPMTVANFVGLAEGALKSNRAQKEPFFNGLTFHRVVPGFIVQGGDPRGDGTGGPGYHFPDEFHPGLSHDAAGVVSMANAGAGTNGSQFFVTLSAMPNLDNRHSVFGHVIEGMQVVEKIAVGDTIKNISIIRIGENANGFIINQEMFDTMVKNHRIKQEKERLIEQKKQAEMINTQYPDAITTSSGIKYMVKEKGDGEKPKAGSIVKVHYTGKFLNGKVFDSSRGGNQPIEFPIGEGHVIRGWEEAILDMSKGERRILIIPPELGYGKRGAGEIIPPNATLLFDVELVDFK